MMAQETYHSLDSPGGVRSFGLDGNAVVEGFERLGGSATADDDGHGSSIGSGHGKRDGSSLQRVGSATKD